MKNKKTLIIILLVLCVGLVGLTIAYFSNSTTIDNLFSTKEYGTTYEEEFVSPANWLPGDTIDKTVTVTNSGQVDQAVRISLSETWTPNNTNATLTGWIHTDGTKSNHETEEELATDERAAIINFTDNSDWTKVGDYYYYNYKLAPNETTDSLIESVTFNDLTKLGDTCTESESNGTKTITCNSSGSDYDNATYTLTFTVETVQYNKYQDAWNTELAIAEEKPLIVYGLNVNRKSKTYENGDKHQMFEFEHAKTVQTPALTDYRYIGDDPYNYVYFNCDDLNNQNSETCEVWRIIGVFDVEDGTGNYEQRIKLVRGSTFDETIQWDNSICENCDGKPWGKNEWDGSKIEVFLNGDYLNRENNAQTYGLKVNARNLISDAKYYLGGATYNRTNGFGDADAIYLWERERNILNYEMYCSELDPVYVPKCESDYCQNNPTDEICNLTRSTSWVGKIGLMYPSDEYLVYINGVESNCYNNPATCGNTYASVYGDSSLGWIYNSNNLENNWNWVWLISPLAHKIGNVFIVSSDGHLDNANVDSNSGAVRPVLYLSSNVKITEGTGEQNNPYKLGL